MSLWSDFLTNDKRLIYKWKHYFPIHEHHFVRFANRDVVFFEIGCDEGGSLQMWKRFLGPHARIIGVDIIPGAAKFAEDQAEIRIGDQSDVQFLEALVKEFRPPDVISDDGSHIMAHVNASFAAPYPLVSRTGVYLVEDLHTAYWNEYGGGLRHSDSFIEYSKGSIDALNADDSRGALEPSAFTRSMLSMHFYDSVVVFEKGRHRPKDAPEIGIRAHPK